MTIGEFEAARTPWRRCSHFGLLFSLEQRARRSAVTVGIDGRSGAGKTSLAQALAAGNDGVAIIHTDDIAWHHSFFDWAEVLIDNILVPLRNSGTPVRYRPVAWRERDREGSIDIPAETRLVLIEGVGACRQELRPYLDNAIWVQTPRRLGYERVAARGADTPDFIAQWNGAEERFLEGDRPWAIADIIISGDSGPFGDGNQSGSVVLAEGPGRVKRWSGPYVS